MIAVSNTSPLILLDKINCLWILGKLFGKIYIPQLALFSDTHRDILLLDDLKARKYAKSLGLSVAGTVGILITAKRKGMISELKPMLEDLKKHRYYLSENIYNEALILANET